MASLLTFWLPLALVLFSWEAVLLNPGRIGLWFGVCLIAAAVIAWRACSGVLDRLSVLLFLAGVFWWGLWIDFATIKFALPVFIAAAFAYVLSSPSRTHLALFLGGVFFWSSIAFGLVTVLGRGLWESLIVFLAVYGVFVRAATVHSRSGAAFPFSLYVVLLLVAAEVFSVLVWLPFTEVTLGLIATAALLFFYDVAKYIADPALIRRKIVIKKVLVYAAFVVLVLASTPWQ
ncbi:MAG: hypothetical protein HY471_00025 [Candidatus Sungbacteria bacterium]|nr:hypothetical protein [Candidatus Sungbacteria bacterium]